MKFNWFRRCTPSSSSKLILVKRMEPLITEHQSVSYESDDGRISVSGFVHPTGKDIPRDGGFLIAKNGLVIEGLFDGLSLNRGKEAVKAAMDFLIPSLLEEGLLVTRRNIFSLLRRCSQKMHEDLYMGAAWMGNEAHALTTLTLAFFTQNGRNWDSHVFVMGDSPAYVFKRKKSGLFTGKNGNKFENSVIMSTDRRICEHLYTYWQYGACVLDPLGRPMEILKIAHRSATLTPGSKFITVTDGISDNLELVLSERPGKPLNCARVIDAHGFFEMCKLVLVDGLSDEAILRLAMQRVTDPPDCSYLFWDPNREYKPSGDLKLIRTTLREKPDDAASMFRTEIM